MERAHERHASDTASQGSASNRSGAVKSGISLDPRTLLNLRARAMRETDPARKRALTESASAELKRQNDNARVIDTLTTQLAALQAAMSKQQEELENTKTETVRSEEQRKREDTERVKAEASRLEVDRKEKEELKRKLEEMSAKLATVAEERKKEKENELALQAKIEKAEKSAIELQKEREQLARDLKAKQEELRTKEETAKKVVLNVELALGEEKRKRKEIEAKHKQEMLEFQEKQAAFLKEQRRMREAKAAAEAKAAKEASRAGDSAVRNAGSKPHSNGDSRSSADIKTALDDIPKFGLRYDNHNFPIDAPFAHKAQLIREMRQCPYDSIFTPMFARIMKNPIQVSLRDWPENTTTYIESYQLGNSGATGKPTSVVYKTFTITEKDEHTETRTIMKKGDGFEVLHLKDGAVLGVESGRDITAYIEGVEREECVVRVEHNNEQRCMIVPVTKTKKKR